MFSFNPKALNHAINKKDACCEPNSLQMLDPGETIVMQLHPFSSVEDAVLANQQDNHSKDFRAIREESTETAFVIVDFGGANQVPDLHHDEELE